MMILPLSNYAQVSTPFNNGVLGNYVGWNNLQAFPLEIRHNANQPINFFTNNTERMRLTQTGFLGIGITNPASLLHLNTTAVAAVQGRFTNSTTGATASDGFQVGISATGEAELRQTENSALLFFTNNAERLRLSQMGWLGLGTNNPQVNFHLHSNIPAVVQQKFTNVGTGATAADGTQIGIQANGDFRLTQFETVNTDFLTRNLSLAGVITRFRLQSNGQIFIGNASMSENVIDGGVVTGLGVFGQTSLLNVRGPINSCGEMNNLAEQPVVLYGYTNPNDAIAPIGDGFRMHMNINFGEVSRDALVFEKTDQNTLTPDGYIAFTNTGMDNIERVSSYIDGTGRTYFGRNLINPTNRVTIESEVGDASPSGLRFMNLTAAATPVTNPGTGVLGVDANGNVIYVNAGSGSAIGNYCSAPTSNPLTGDYRIPLNDFNLYFEGSNTLGKNHFGVGYACGSALLGKISSIQEHPFSISTSYTNTNAGYFCNRDESETFFTQFFGVYGISDGINMYDGSRNVGGYFTANNGMQSQGVVGLGQGGKYSLGLYGEATGGTISNYGVYGTASGTDPWAGFFNGAGFLAAGAWTYSDQNLKHHIQEFQEANSILSQLNPVRYDFKTADYPELNLSSAPQIGLIAQELEQVLPQAVRDTRTPEKRDSLGNLIAESIEFKAVSYEKLIPVLVGGHQEQQATIDQLQVQNQNLQNQLDQLQNQFNQLQACLQNMFPDMCQLNPHGMIQQNTPAEQNKLKNEIDVQLSNKNAIVLNQNVQNPFAEKTVISFSIPATIGKAQIHFYDAKGILIQSIEINERGAGQLNVFGSDLSSGMYSYSLVADGKVVDTKRMVKSN